MSFDKDYPNRKDWRKPYYSGSKRFDRTCRNHGSCDWCRDNRLHQRIKEEMKSKFDMKDYLDCMHDYDVVIEQDENGFYELTYKWDVDGSSYCND